MGVGVVVFLPRSTGNYHPVLYVNEFWLQQKHLLALNSTVESVDLELSISPISLWKFQVCVCVCVQQEASYVFVIG